MIERIRYGGVNNPYNYSEFVCDTVVDLADLPTTVSVDKYKKFDTCSIGSKATVISNKTTYILNSNNQWIMLNDYKTSGGSIVVDETLTESGQAADSKVVGDKFLLLENWQTTQNDYINNINIKISSIESNSVGQKTDDGGEIFNDYENNIATTYAHAEGGNTTASGDYSHAEGHNTIASSENQHVQGKYNVEDIDGKYAFIIGNGEDSNNRSNAFAIDWNGLFYLNNSDTGIDLSEISVNVTKLINDSSRHVHTNMQALIEITDADITALHSTFPQKIYEIEQSLSDYATKEEVTQARIDANGTTYSTLKERLDSTDENVESVSTELKEDLSNFSEDTTVAETSENILDLTSSVLENIYILDSQASVNNELPILYDKYGYYTLKMLVNEVSTYYIYWLNSSLSSYTSFNSNAYITDENNVVLNKIGLSEHGVISSCEGAKFLYITLNQFVPSVKKPMVFTQDKDKSTMVYEEYYKKNIVDINKSNIKKLTFSGCITAEYDGKKDVNIMISDNNPLNYKTLLFTGDSICFGAGDRDISNLLTQHDDMQYVAGSGITAYNNTGWAQIIAENNPKTIVYGYGVPGTCIARQQSQIDSDGYDSSILERISVMKESADYVIFHGGINDQGRKITLGSVRNSGNMSDYSTTDYDEFTFAGAVEMMIINARQKWPDAKLGFILTPKVRGREHKNCIVDGVDYRQCVYMDIIKEACEKWGVPVLDLYRCVSSYFNGDNATYYYNGDSLHPTKKTYQQEIAPKVESWLKSL